MTTAQQQAFIDKIASLVQKYAPQYDIHICSTIIAQAILESGWGTSVLAQKNNFFGLKCRADWTGPSINIQTKEEYTLGTITDITANFQVFDSVEAGVKGYFEFLQVPWYSNLKGITDPFEYARLIKEDGYCTISTYVSNLTRLINDYDLTKYDPEKKGGNMAKLFIICGHGAGDPGAGGSTGGKYYTEAERVRALAARMKELAGDQVEIGDTNINWYASAKLNTFNTTLPVLELHMDSASGSARGGHVIISDRFEPDNYDNKLADFITGMFPGRSQKIFKRGNLANVNRAANRGINYRLIECCFISNPEDLAKFNNELDAVAIGIMKCFGIEVNSTNYVGWINNGNGWWWQNADGSYPKNEWQERDGEWYWFDDTGYAATEWRELGGKWYWFNRQGEDGPECAMAKSTVRYIWGEWYAFGKDGAMITDSVKVAENGHLILE